jgi:hypothetical protein
MHAYLKQLNPTIKIEQCDKPAGQVLVYPETAVRVYCINGHHIKSKIYPTQEKALLVAERLKRWIDHAKV